MECSAAMAAGEKCFHWLRSQGSGWNHKRVHCVYCNMKLNLPRRTRKQELTAILNLCKSWGHSTRSGR